MAKQMELKIWIDKNVDYQCHFKGKPSEASEAITFLMCENVEFKNMMSLGVLAYQNVLYKHGCSPISE